MSKLNECYLCESEIQHGEGLCESCATEANIIAGLEEATKAPKEPVTALDIVNRVVAVAEGNYRLCESKTDALYDAVETGEQLLRELDEWQRIQRDNAECAETRMERKFLLSVSNILKTAVKGLEALGIDYDGNYAPMEQYNEGLKAKGLI